jgi:hypothetical protein
MLIGGIILPLAPRELQTRQTAGLGGRSSADGRSPTVPPFDSEPDVRKFVSGVTLQMYSVLSDGHGLQVGRGARRPSFRGIASLARRASKTRLSCRHCCFSRTPDSQTVPLLNRLHRQWQKNKERCRLLKTVYEGNRGQVLLPIHMLRAANGYAAQYRRQQAL